MTLKSTTGFYSTKFLMFPFFPPPYSPVSTYAKATLSNYGPILLESLSPSNSCNGQ